MLLSMFGLAEDYASFHEIPRPNFPPPDCNYSMDWFFCFKKTGNYRIS